MAGCGRPTSQGDESWGTRCTRISGPWGILYNVPTLFIREKLCGLGSESFSLSSFSLLNFYLLTMSPSAFSHVEYFHRRATPSTAATASPCHDNLLSSSSSPPHHPAAGKLSPLDHVWASFPLSLLFNIDECLLRSSFGLSPSHKEISVLEDCQAVEWLWLRHHGQSAKGLQERDWSKLALPA